MPEGPRGDDGAPLRFTVALSFSPPEHFVPVARAADELGYHAIACSDHVVDIEEMRTPYPYTKDGSKRWKPGTPWLDPWVAIGAMASVTTRLRFMTNVYVLPMRNPFHTAKVVGTAAILSGGRVALGVGMGWCEEEFDLLEQPFAGRGKRADEQLEVIRTLWSGDMVEHHGEHYDFGRLGMHPAVPPVPVYVGGMSEPALRRAARNDGFISDLLPTAELAEYRRRIDEHRVTLGRDHLPFAMVGSSKDAADVDGYREVRAAGVTDLITMPWLFYHGFTDDLDERIDGLHRFAEDILPHFQD